MNRKPLILYADDNAGLVAGWKALLEAKGYEVLTANDGTEAVGAFTSNPVDLALLDYHMPHMNGDVAAAEMKTRKADVPVALMSADHLPVLANLKAVDAFVCKIGSDSQSPGHRGRAVEPPCAVSATREWGGWPPASLVRCLLQPNYLEEITVLGCTALLQRSLCERIDQAPRTVFVRFLARANPASQAAVARTCNLRTETCCAVLSCQIAALTLGLGRIVLGCWPDD